MSRAFLKDSSGYAFAYALEKAIPFLLLPVFTRYLSPSDYGIVAVFNVATTIAQILGSVCSNAAITRSYFDRSPSVLAGMTGDVIKIIVIMMVVSLFLCFLLSTQTNLLSDLPVLVRYSIPVVGACASLSDVLLSHWRVRGRIMWFGGYEVLRTLLTSLVSLILVISYSMTWRGRIYAVLGAELFFGILALTILFRSRYLIFLWKAQQLKSLLAFSLPLAPHAMGTWVLSSVDRFILRDRVGLDQLGIYTAAISLASFLAVVRASLDKAIAPQVYAELTARKDRSKTNAFRMVLLYQAVMVGAGGVVVAAVVLGGHWIVGPRFIEATQYVLWLVVAQIIIGSRNAMIPLVLFTRKTYIMGRITLLTSSIHILTCYFLVQMLGVRGAVFASIGSAALSYLLTSHAAMRETGLRWNSWRGTDPRDPQDDPAKEVPDAEPEDSIPGENPCAKGKIG